MTLAIHLMAALAALLATATIAGHAARAPGLVRRLMQQLDKEFTR